MDVKICTADSAGSDLDENVIVSEFGQVDFDNVVVLRLGVPVGEEIWLARLDGMNH